MGVPKETREGERRVAQTPTSVAALVKAGFKVVDAFPFRMALPCRMEDERERKSETHTQFHPFFFFFFFL